VPAGNCAAKVDLGCCLDHGFTLGQAQLFYVPLEIIYLGMAMKGEWLVGKEGSK
jgi:hypothetical protein